MNTDILHILPGIQEQQAFGKFDNENKDSRPFRCKDGTINFNRPMNSKRERLCEPGKSVPDKDIELCTYGGKLDFFGKFKDFIATSSAAVPLQIAIEYLFRIKFFDNLVQTN